MLAGELFVLLGLKTNDDEFRQGLVALALLQRAASEVVSAVQEVGRALFDMALDAAHTATHTLGMAASLGMSTKSMQEWLYVAKQAGGDANRFATGISMLERNLREFAEGRGSKRFKAAMHDMKISQDDAKKSMVGEDGINGAIFLVSDAYHKMGNDALRSADNAALVGARNREMVQDLAKGSEFLRSQFSKANSLGNIISDEELANLKTFGNELDNVKGMLNAMATHVVAKLAPEFSKMLQEMQRWLSENRVLIETVLTAAFKALSFAITQIFNIIKFVGKVIKGFLDGDTGAVALVAALTIGVIAFALALVSLALPAIIAVGVALWAAMLPILPIVAAIVAIAALAYLIYKNWGPIKEWFGGLWDWISEKAKAFWNWLGDTINSIGTWFENLGHTIWHALGDVWTSIVDTAKSALQKLVNDVIWIVNKIISALNFLPGVHISAIADVDWVKHKSPTTAPDGSAGSTSTGAPRASVGNATGSGGASGQQAVTNVNVAPTTININGVKDAEEAKKKIGDEIDNRHRHAAAALGGEVQ